MLRFSLVVCAVLITGPGTAGTITQMMSVRQGGHDTHFSPYAQFNSALGTLIGVRLDFTNGTALSNNWTFTNNGSTPLTSIDTIHGSLVYGDQFIDLTRSFIDNFTSAVDLINHQTSIPFAGTTIVQGSLDRWIGTGTLGPDTVITSLSGFATTTIPQISSFHDDSGAIMFTEMITYNYMTVPEPRSWVLWIMGLIGVTIFSDRWTGEP